jgi:V/A-type H+-transporting ATPase subunit K
MKMDTLWIVVAPLLVVALLCLPLVCSLQRMKNGKKSNPRRSVIANLCSFAAICLGMILVPVGGLVFAATDAAAATEAAAATASGMGYIAAAVVTGLSCIGAGIAVGNAAPAAIGAVSEDPKAFAKALIFVVLGEGVAIYGLLISILILNKI